MADSLGIGEAMAEIGAQGGTEELKDFSETTLREYKERFRQHEKNLTFYIENYKMSNLLGGNKEEPFIKTVMEKIKDVNELNETISHYSSKGGAFITDKQKLEEFMQDMKMLYDKQQKTKTKKEITKQNNIYKFQQILLEVSRDVYKLKNDVTGITESFSFIYTGAGGAAEVVNVPVDQFFKSILGFQMNLGIFNISYSSKDNSSSYGLRFNKSAMTSILSQLGGTPLQGLQGQSFNDFYNAQMTPKEMSVLGKDLFKGESKRLAKTFGTLREDESYLVQRREFQSGFVAQKMLESILTGQKYEYKQDTVPWWKGSDIEIGDQGYSVKSFLEKAPSFVNLSSCLTAVKSINKFLQQNLQFTDIKGALKSQIWSAANRVGGAAEQGIIQEVESMIS